MSHTCVVDALLLNINLNGITRKDKKLWRSLVDRRKVYKALKILKDINSNYTDIDLPDREEDFLPDVFGADDDETMGDDTADDPAVRSCQYCSTGKYEHIQDRLLHEETCPQNPDKRRDSETDGDGADSQEVNIFASQP